MFQAFALLQTNLYSPSLPPYSMMASLQWPWSGQGCSSLGLLRHAAVFHVTCETFSAEGGRGMLQAGSLGGPVCSVQASAFIVKKVCCCLRACLLPCSVEPYAPPRAPHRCRCHIAREMQESFGFSAFRVIVPLIVALAAAVSLVLKRACTSWSGAPRGSDKRMAGGSVRRRIPTC